MEKATILDKSAMLLLKGGAGDEMEIVGLGFDNGGLGGNGDDTPTGDKAGTDRTNLSDRI